jgi:D-alanyl-D-alanine carboxypeptidase
MLEPARTAARRNRSTGLAALAVVSATLVGVLVYESPAWSSSTAASPMGIARSEQRGALGEADGAVPDGTMVRRRESRGALGEADGLVPDGTTVFADEIPGVANLEPDVLGALRQAATDAADDGVEFFVYSGWRSPEYQERLLQEAAREYGSEDAAARWVATPNTSAHVSGDAVDLGHADATAWLSRYGAAYGLCQIYRNEPWHYELRREAIDQGCPPMYPDPRHDPTMQQ